MARPLSRDLRQRVVAAVMDGGLSNNKAAARFGIAISTANLWVRKFKATGSLDHGKIGGHKPAALRVVGARLALLPKYSPDLDPIWQVFAKLKHLLRTAQARSRDAV